MAYLSGIETRAEWADKLVAKHAPPYWRCVFYLPKTGKPRTGVYGHASVGQKRIELAVSSAEESLELKWVVLHEIAHAIHRRHHSVETRGRKTIHHPPAFWEIAYSLYKRYPEVIPMALEREYSMGKKYIRARMAQG